MTIDVPEIQLAANGYYVAVELYSNALEMPILIYDDTSVLQPSQASMFFDPVDDTWYTNPNAVSLRIGIDGFEIGFPFSFYGEEYTEFLVNPNGWIGFSNDNQVFNIGSFGSFILVK